MHVPNQYSLLFGVPQRQKQRQLLRRANKIDEHEVKMVKLVNK